MIDESGYWRMKEGVALVIPEVNPEAALNAKGIIASPNCSTTQMVMALKPLHDASPAAARDCQHLPGDQRCGACRGPIDLIDGTRAHLDGTDYEYQAFAHPIAFNAIPQIGSEKAGYTSEELKMVYETRKILGDDSMQINATCVRIPGRQLPQREDHGRDRTPDSPEEARELFAAFPESRSMTTSQTGRYPLPSHLHRSRRSVHRPHSPRSLASQRSELLVRQRQPPQGGRHQRRADRRTGGSESPAPSPPPPRVSDCRDRTISAAARNPAVTRNGRWPPRGSPWPLPPPPSPSLQHFRNRRAF